MKAPGDVQARRAGVHSRARYSALHARLAGAGLSPETISSASWVRGSAPLKSPAAMA
jgi:hypothetical protein